MEDVIGVKTALLYNYSFNFDDWMYEVGTLEYYNKRCSVFNSRMLCISNWDIKNTEKVLKG